ncbi:protein RRP6-like 2 isoform X2 [Hibiscus syriacus]|uniref:protein RRP6-like 2 isoform X2 n=1 Tax=Hibiscus syriacus TaxID=106335 RepID=UPI001921040F|nr:protein RRP6-like 2 isoform X2 [Hibiscus syriacus]
MNNNDQISMEDQSQPSKSSQVIQKLASGPLSSSLSSLSSSSRTLPSNQDFHFFNNFNDFKLPIDQIAKISDSLLESIGASAKTWGANKVINFPNNIESIVDDEAYDWLVDINDEIWERFDVSMDEFQKIRKKEEASGRFIGSDPDNIEFQLVNGKKKKKKVDGGLMSDSAGVSVSGIEGGGLSSSGVKVKQGALATGTTGKAKVPFHIPTIRKPQEEYKILVNNSNQPFEHVWLQRSEDGQRFVHPLEKLSVMDFVDKDIADIEPVKPPSIESTSFKLVEEVKDLKDLAAKLRSVQEFAVDLEHNQYRSFQGLTCLIQISTRTEDFIVDTLKLRIHVGPYLREVFKDHTKKKVMHGADRDIVWLQRDFGIYVCNLFDTGQASRVLKLERNSLEHLLQHFCGVTANKEYQNADWRLRPLPDEMLRYAREDTHYLLYIYDLMRIELLSMPKEGEHLYAPLVEVYKRSFDVCMQLYEKEILTENSYLHIYGLQVSGFNAEQLAIVAGLCEWRDNIARVEDESTGYVLPNKTLLEIAKQMPITAHKLRRLLKSKHPYVERNLGVLVSIIRQSMQNAVAFEAAAQQLKMGRTLNAPEHIASNEVVKVLLSEVPTDLKIANDGKRITDGAMVGPDGITAQAAYTQHKQEYIKIGSSVSELDTGKKQEGFSFEPHVNGSSVHVRENLAISGESGDANATTVIPPSANATGATIQILKKPSRGLGALLGNASTKKKVGIEKMEKEESKLAQIRSSVNLSFHSFSGTEELSKTPSIEPTKLPAQPEEPPAVIATESLTSEDVIMLEDNSNKDEQIDVGDNSEVTDRPEESSMTPSSEMEKEDETMSLSDLSTSFQQCFESMNQNRKAVKVKKSKEPSGLLQIKPFDYEAARKEVKFGEDAEDESGSHAKHAGKKKKGSAGGRLEIDDGSKQFPQARRRRAFPASGNRSATFR